MQQEIKRMLSTINVVNGHLEMMRDIVINGSLDPKLAASVLLATIHFADGLAELTEVLDQLQKGDSTE